jgi:hypothetical protein
VKLSVSANEWKPSANATEWKPSTVANENIVTAVINRMSSIVVSSFVGENSPDNTISGINSMGSNGSERTSVDDSLIRNPEGIDLSLAARLEYREIEILLFYISTSMAYIYIYSYI